MAHLLEAIPQFGLETGLGMLLVIVGERAEVVPVPKIDLPGKPCPSYDQIPLDSFHLGSNIFGGLFLVLKLRF